MSINLLDVIRDESAIKSGGFTGAIFLTYSLNLAFFEQIIAPALDQAGCSNVLILVDPDGYQQALEIGAKSIQSVGLRYVCSPIARRGQGIQHAKMLFMAGPNRGRLLIGSGNLTFHGYGRNLELYSQFEYDASDTSTNTSPFDEAWILIQDLVNDGGLSTSAQQHIKAIRDGVSWLNSLAQNPEPVIWHNYYHPLLEQLNGWRKSHGFTGPVKKINAISPYYDQHLTALKYLATNLSPRQLEIHLDPALTNLEGKKAIKEWRGISSKLGATAIGPGDEQNSHRHVHAKGIIGEEANGSWCITGSANLSHSALLTNWKDGGNLELVVFHWSENTKAFDYLLKDELVSTWPLELSSISGTEVEPSDRAITQIRGVFLTDLSLQGGKVEGRLSEPLPAGIQNVRLHLQRMNLDIPFSLQDETSFIAGMRSPLDEAEAARVEGEGFITPYRWIDQPDVLARFGARTYQVRIKGKLETLLGAEKLFQELMNFLWERVNVESKDQVEPELHLGRSSFKKKTDGAKPEDEPTPPGPEAFITEEELISSIHSRIDHHYPYDRSLVSLRDLLSLVLLRLTATTQSTSVDDSDQRDEEKEQEKQAEQDEMQISILERLRSYLLGYCNRYANRLVDPQFIRNISPETIFQNHYTLGRVLLEFANKASHVFLNEDLFRCFWLIWAPLVWPEIVGLKGATPTINTLIGQYKKQRVMEAWQSLNLPTLARIMTGETLRQPPNWEIGLRYNDQVEAFLVASEWIRRTKQMLGNNAFLGHTQDYIKAFGITNISSLYSLPAFSESYLDYVLSNFNKIENYHPPVEEKYALLFELEKTIQSNPKDEKAKQALISEINARGLGRECDAFLANPKPIYPAVVDEEGEIYCPRCGAELTENSQRELMRGQLVPCHNSKDAWLYLKPQIPESIL